jgi:hypothetical protein
MGALTIEKVEVPAQRSARFCDGVVGLEVDLLVLHRSPEPLDEHVVAPGALAVHADGDPVLLKDAGERLAGELMGWTAPRAASNVPGWSLSKPHLRRAVHGQV